MAELEQQNDHQSLENQRLRAELAKIQGTAVDSNFAHSSDFTFNLPSNNSLRRDSHSSANGGSPLQNIPRGSDCPSLCSSHTSPQSAIEKDFNAATMPFFSRNESYAESHNSSSESGRYSLSTNETSASDLVSVESPFTTLMSKANQIPFSLSESFNMQHQDYNFNALDYRDTGIFNNFDIDPPLFENQGIFEAFGSPRLDLDLFATTDPVAKLDRQSAGDVEVAQVVLPEAGTTDTSNTGWDGACQQVWQRVVSHPKFASFDLDALCEEFKNKNKCSQEAPGHSFPKAGPEAWKEIDLALDDFVTRQESHRASPVA